MLKRNSNPNNNNNGTDRRRRRSSVQTEKNYKLELDANQIECLIMSLAEQCNDKTMKASYKARFQGMADQKDDTTNSAGMDESFITTSTRLWTHEELQDIITALQALLGSIAEPSSDTVAEVHSTIGIIHQRLNHDARATQSFLQALWVQTSCDNVPPTTLGLTKLRLALAYGRKGQNQEAINILEMALIDFSKGGLDDNHELVVRANEAMHGFHLALVHRNHRRNSRRISQGAA